MTRITEYSSLAETDAALQSRRASAQKKDLGAGKTPDAFSTVLDTVSISGSARNKNVTAAADEESGNSATGKNGGGQFRNETQALKAAIQELAAESGTSVGGWGLGHYRKAFRNSEEGDLSAVRGIFIDRYGLKETPAAEDPAVDPSDADPSAGGELPGVDENPVVENPADGELPVGGDAPADLAGTLADIIGSGETEETSAA